MFTARSVLEAATDGQPTLPTPTSCGNTLLVVRLGYDQFERTLLRPLAEKGGEEDHKECTGFRKNCGARFLFDG